MFKRNGRFGVRSSHSISKVLIERLNLTLSIVGSEMVKKVRSGRICEVALDGGNQQVCGVLCSERLP